MLLIKVQRKKLLVWCFVEGMDHLAGPTAGNEGSMDCSVPAESLRREKTLNILTIETPGKADYTLHVFWRLRCHHLPSPNSGFVTNPLSD